MHASFQREYQNHRDAVLMQVSKCRTFAAFNVQGYLYRTSKFSECEHSTTPQTHTPPKQTLDLCCVFKLLPDDLVWKIVLLSRIKCHLYPLERKMLHGVNQCKYALLPNGVSLNVCKQPTVSWLLENINTTNLPDKYWKTHAEFVQSPTSKQSSQQWFKAQRRSQDDRRFDRSTFMQHFVPKCRDFAMQAVYSKWCVPLRARVAGTDAKHHMVHVYETVKSKTWVLDFLHDLIGPKCTAEMTIVKSIHVPNKAETTVVFLLGVGVFRAPFEDEVLFTGFSTWINDPRIAPLCKVPCGTVIFI
jgi:hypothetical protein